MVNIEKIINDIQKKRKYENISHDELPRIIKKLQEDFNIEDEVRLKYEIIIALDKIDSTLWEVRDGDEYILDDGFNIYIDNIVKKGDYINLTIHVCKLKELYQNNIDINEYYEYKELFVQRNLPEENIIELLKLPKKLRSQIINNLDSQYFGKIVRNNHCKLYKNLPQNAIPSQILNINNTKIYSTPYQDDFNKDSFYVETLEDLNNVDKMVGNKIDELFDDKYSVYDIKREYCNRFLNIDPIILENCFYNPKNKEILDRIDNKGILKKLINIGINDKKDMIRIYVESLNEVIKIDLPDNLLTYGYAYTTPKEVVEIKTGDIDYNEDKYYHEIYFCRECLLDSNQRKRDRETQFEIPIGTFRNFKHFTYENVVRNNVYERNMSYPKIELRKEEIDSHWYIRDYLTLEAINSNVDINNPKRFDNEIPMSKSYSHLYDSYMYKEEYDRKQKEKNDEELEKNMNDIFKTVGLTTDEVRDAMIKKAQSEEDPII